MVLGDRISQQISARAARTPLPPEVSYVSDNRVMLTQVGNISLSGAFVASKTPDPIGTCGTLAFRIDGQSYGVPVIVTRVSFWSGPDQSQAGMGLSFISPPRHVRKAIRAWQMRFSSDDSQPTAIPQSAAQTHQLEPDTDIFTDIKEEERYAY